MLLAGVLVAVPLTALFFFPEDRQYALSFLIPGLGSLLMGGIVCFIGREEGGVPVRMTTTGRGSLIILFAWAWGMLMGAIPFRLSGLLSPVRALFESVSGWTTTGLTVIDVAATPHIFLLHRSFMQFCGGLGFAFMMTCLIQASQSMILYSAEGHPDKLLPNLKKTARTILLIYSSILVTGITAYLLTGMPLFEAVCHAMCALSTAGFSTQPSSIGVYNSLAVELITIGLMLTGATSFAVLLLMVQGKWRRAFRVSELRFMFLLLLFFIPVVALALSEYPGMSLVEGLRRAAFGVVTALTTTGYSTMDYGAWPPFATGILILLMLMGGGFGSTAGGIKLTRIYILLRVSALNICKRVSSRRNVEVLHYFRAQGKMPIDQTLKADTTCFIITYLFIYVAGVLLITLTSGCTLTEAMFEFASALGGVGLSIGVTGPATDAGTLLVEMLGMTLGRLEIFIVLTGIYSAAVAIKQFFIS